MLDLYEVLGVPEDATQEEIRRAYRAAARREHPDVSGRPDAAERMQSLNDAFRVLGDEKTRDAYDHGRIPPQGWGDERNPWDPWDPDPPRPRRRRGRTGSGSHGSHGLRSSPQPCGGMRPWS